jgi:hypothetical protein
VTEVIKHNPRQYCGWQTKALSESDVRQRMCVATGCSNPGYSQAVLGATWGHKMNLAVVVCKRHMLLISLDAWVRLGNPDAIDEAKNLAERLEIDWQPEEMKQTPVSQPEDWRCGECGGQLAAETAGMFKGRRWVHTCGTTTREAANVGVDGAMRAPDFKIVPEIDDSNSQCRTVVMDPASNGTMFWQCTRRLHPFDDGHAWPHPLAAQAYRRLKDGLETPSPISYATIQPDFVDKARELFNIAPKQAQAIQQEGATRTEGPHCEADVWPGGCDHRPLEAEPVRTAYCGPECSEGHTYEKGCIKHEPSPTNHSHSVEDVCENWCVVRGGCGDPACEHAPAGGQHPAAKGA